jgi:hypothetical protein
MVWIGLYPGPILRRTEGAARMYIEMVEPYLSDTPGVGGTMFRGGTR